MASDIALAVVGKIVEKTVDPIVDTVVRQCSYLFCYKKNIETLLGELAGLEASRDGVELRIVEAGWNLETPDPTVKLWLTNVDGVKSKAMVVRECTSDVEKGCLNGWCPNLKRRYLLSRKAAKLSADIGQLKRQGDKDPKFSHPARPIGIVPPFMPSVSPKDDGFKGYATRMATLNDVMDALNDDKINLIGISGMGGVGKTTLVNQVIDKVKAESLFKEVAMAVVSQKPDSIKIQGEIAQMLGLKFEDGSTSVARAERLRSRLKNGGRVLVVLDDIWETIDLCEVGIPAGNGCKVVLTTRNEDVCIEMEVQRHIKVDMLSQPEAWDLFRKEAGDSVEDDDICDIAKDVAKECGGLPIAIVTLGKALSKRKKHEWEDTMLKLKQASGMAGKVKSSILLSYDFLGSRKPEAQPLLLLCTLFQEDTNIPIEQLVKYSMGLDQLSKEVATLEQTRNRVCTLVDNLKFCNLLLQGDGKYADLCVRLHDVVRDVCMSIASNPPHAYLVSHAKEMKQWPIHYGDKSDHTAIALTSGAMNELPGGLDYPNLHLLQLQLESENIDIPGEFFQGMRGLKVFNFDGKRDEYGSGCDVRVPQTLGHLTNLQALSLENCILGGDVSSIGCLKGLKILSFYRSQLLVWFPNEEVGALKNLKLLDLRCQDYEACGLELESCVLSGLDQLEVLYMGSCFVFSESVKELKSLCCLTTLQVSVSNSKILLELEQPFFEKLKRFDIFIGSEGGFSCGDYGIIQNNITQCEDDLSWASHAKLRSLVRRIQSLKLEDLEEERFMSDERESGFSGLVNLESLKIQDMKHLIQIVPPDGNIPEGSFHRLQVLFLRGLPALKHLWSRAPVQPPSLSNLRDVTIFDCDSIESLFSPEVAKCMLQLEKLDIRYCESLEGVVVSNQGKEGFKNIQFPNLKSMDLSKLPKFKSFFYPGSNNEDLDGECDTIHTLFNQLVSFPGLEKIELVGVGTVELIVGYRMESGLANKLRSIYVSMCNKLRNFADSTMLENLEEVNIYRCDSMKVVFDLEGLKVGGEDSAFVFDKLASIKLNGLKKLAHVWRMVPDSIQGFRNVTTLVVKKCKELRYLMSYSVAKMLVNLQVLELGQCDKIVGVIEGEDEEECSREAKSNGCIVFPRLQELELVDLQNLSSFCSSKCSLEFPLLEDVEIRRCPDMKRFCGGEVTAPLLKEPVEDAEGGEWFWKGNLNNGNNRAKRDVEAEDELA